MNTCFWRFWSDCDGFQFEPWLKAYESQYLIPDRKFKSSVTRKNIKVITEAGEGCEGPKVLETNLYAIATSKARDLDVGGKKLYVLLALLNCTKPKVIIAHGAPAYSEMLNIQKALLVPGWTEAVVIPSPHLGNRAIFSEFAKYLGREAVRAC
jgi:hypothetical protein